VLRASLFATILLAGALLAAPDTGFLGPRGTFSETAAETYCATVAGCARTVAFPTITGVVAAVREGRVERAVIPVASTVAGFPPESAGLLLAALDPGFRVLEEVVVPVELHLLVKPGTRRERIHRIASHPNALKEAGNALRRLFPNVPLEPTASTAAAAEAVAQGDGTLAAVGSLAAGKLYGLTILERAIQENHDNATSFWAIQRADTWAPDPAANRLVVSLEAETGSAAFSALMAAMHEPHFSVVFVNSTPLPGKLYGFRYIVLLAAPSPVPRERVDTVLASCRECGGRVLLLGAFRHSETRAPVMWSLGGYAPPIFVPSAPSL
jgi:prephenate dehydratase